LEYGYAIVEKNWTIENGLVTLPSVKGHDPAKWVFDENGTPGLKTVEKPEPTAVPIERIIHATFDAPRGNPYGRSILIEAFWPWYWKKHAILFWSIFCEKFGQPTIIGWHAKGAETEEITSLLETLESIQSDTAVTLEEGWRIELMEAKRTGTDSYQAFVQYCDRAISKAILSTVLTTNESQYGTRAQAVEQKDVTDEVLEADALKIQDITNKDVVQLLAGWNFNFTVPPQLYIHYDAKSIPKEEAEGDKIQQELMPIPLDDLYKKYGWTKPEGDTPVIFNGVITTWDAIMKGQAQGQVNQGQPAYSKFSSEENLTQEMKEKDEKEAAQ
jgi:phage gp29-like protein